MHQKHVWRDVLSVAFSRVAGQSSALFIIGGIFVLVVGAIGLFVSLNSAGTSQDLRQQAASGNGIVEVSLNVSDASFAANQISNIPVYLDTKNAQIDGVQLVLQFPPSFANPVAQVRSGLPVQIAYQETEQTSNATLLKLILINQQISQPILTSGSEKILDISFTPSITGNYQVSADNERSIVTQHASDPPQDILKPITPVSVNITRVGPSPPITPTVPPGSTPTPTPPCTAFTRPEEAGVACSANEGLVISWNDTNPNSESSAEEAGFKIYRIDNDPEYDRTGTPSNPPVAILPTHPGSGQMTYTYADPDVRFGYVPNQFYRFLIYTWKEPIPGRPIGCWKQSAIGKACPATVPTKTPTPTPSPVAQCNALCRSELECPSDLICYFGSGGIRPNVGMCRNPQNPEDDQCRPPSVTPQPSIVPSCNALCRSDLECSDALFCYFGPGGIMDSGRCRLKENPENESCQAATNDETSLNFAVRLQGLSKPGVAVKAKVWLEPQGDAELTMNPIPVAYTYDIELLSEKDGLLKPTTPLLLKGVPVDKKYTVYVKTEWSLRKIIGDFYIKSGKIDISADTSKQTLIVGDFINTPEAQWNKITILDLGAMLHTYTELVIPVTEKNQQFDVNYDQKIDILDLSLVLSNFTQLELTGD
ncbi:hypothetical protein KC921_02210 [Candidatus Woesebacteria bacterium]|nr:hypothetical protein [Candidatus Woesebacteria bacterium]